MATDAQKLEVKQLLIKQFRLRMEPQAIADSAPLFGEGLGLDSVDAIELVSAVERAYRVQIADEEESRRVLASVETLTDYLAARGALA